MNVSPNSTQNMTTPSFWRLWFFELRLTWVMLFLLSILPSLLLSTGLSSFFLLMFAVLLVAPATAIGNIFGIKVKATEIRKLTIMVLVPMLSTIYIMKSDDQITKNAAPIISAVEAYRTETGHYPDTLDALFPKHLGELPKLNYLLVQPKVSYDLTDGKPELRISAAAGGFAHFAYDFESKAWAHNT